MLASSPLGSMDYSGDLTHKLYTNNNPMPLFFFGNGPSDFWTTGVHFFACVYGFIHICIEATPGPAGGMHEAIENPNDFIGGFAQPTSQ